MAQIDENLLNHLFKLSRIKEERDPVRRKKLLTDLSKILDYFTQLQKVDTDGVKPLAGGSDEYNVWRDDDSINDSVLAEDLRNSFPTKEQTHLKVPPVFD
jgi:aspartyl-tRNA(Asn)/glutamyl-tRNA(Gln) amidotransferase subunit C